MFTIYASNYAPINPLVPPCDINLIPIGYVGENLARCLVFDLSECVEQFGDGGFVISFLRHGDELPYLVTNTDRLEDNAIWNITDTDTAVDGYGLVQLQYIVDEVVCKSALYRTVTFESNGITGDVPDPYEDLLAQIAAYASTAQSSAAAAVAAAATATTAVEEGVKTERSQRIAADDGLSARIDSLQASVGAPLTTTQASAMTDVNKIYVYTGSETGYTFGNWYYYNGAEWVSGGIYNSEGTNIDDSLTMAGFAADAKAAGDRINAAFVVESTSGSIASFADGADGVPLKDLVVNIVPKQSGTGDPSPSNVRAISGWTAAKIYATGNNLFDSSTVVQGSLSSPTAATRCSNRGSEIPIAAGTKITCSSQGSVQFELAISQNGTVVYTSGWKSGSFTYTVAVDGAILLSFRYADSSNIVPANVVDSQIAVNLGATALEYEPYGNTYNISFGSSAGTVYGGTLNVTTGMLTVDRCFITGSGWSQYNQNNGYKAYRRVVPKSGASSIPETMPVSNMISEFGTFSSSSMSKNILQPPVGANEWAYMALDETVDVSQLELSYIIAQPVSYQLDPVTIASLIGNNNIWSDTGSVASCEYRADTKLYLEKLTNPDDDMVANANITSGHYFMVGNSLYLATANIANGGAITPGTNCTATNLAAALNAINS